MTDAPDHLELRLGAVAHGGHVVARTDEGRVVFVRHGLPGELVRVRLTDRDPAASFWRADVTDVLEPAPGAGRPTRGSRRTRSSRRARTGHRSAGPSSGTRTWRPSASSNAT